MRLKKIGVALLLVRVVLNGCLGAETAEVAYNRNGMTVVVPRDTDMDLIVIRKCTTNDLYEPGLVGNTGEFIGFARTNWFTWDKKRVPAGMGFPVYTNGMPRPVKPPHTIAFQYDPKTWMSNSQAVVEWTNAVVKGNEDLQNRTAENWISGRVDQILGSLSQCVGLDTTRECTIRGVLEDECRKQWDAMQQILQRRARGEGRVVDGDLTVCTALNRQNETLRKHLTAGEWNNWIGREVECVVIRKYLAEFGAGGRWTDEQTRDLKRICGRTGAVIQGQIYPVGPWALECAQQIACEVLTSNQIELVYRERLLGMARTEYGNCGLSVAQSNAIEQICQEESAGKRGQQLLHGLAVSLHLVCKRIVEDILEEKDIVTAKIKGGVVLQEYLRRRAKPRPTEGRP